MRSTLCLAVGLTFCAASTQTEATTRAKRTAFQLNGTTWTYVFHGMKMRESIDPHGSYVESSIAGKRIDYGTAVLKGGKSCFTSAIVKKEMCWTNKPVDIGQSIIVTSDKGQKLKVRRVEYTPVKLSMSK